MKKVLATLDNSLAGRPVITAAQALAGILGAEVEAFHVRTNGDRTAHSTAEAAGIPLRVSSGPVVERLVAAAHARDVVAVAIGSRGTPAGRRPLGGTASALVTGLHKPVLIVPPDASPNPRIRRVLVPIEASVSKSLAPRSIIELAADAEVEVHALHIHDEESIPAFTDQPQHEQTAWAKEFLHRYCPWGLGSIRLETRVGRIDELVPLVAEECCCDLIALGWSRRLSHDRALVVRTTLERSHLPVLLVPVELDAQRQEAETLTGAAPMPQRAGRSGC
jgi:nucleotide-binding universal stress UspA family protein